MARQRELTKSAEQRKVREQNARASENPVANWKTAAGTKPLAQKDTALAGTNRGTLRGVGGYKGK